MPPRPQQTYLQGQAAKKNAVLAKDAKVQLAVAKADLADRHGLDLLKKTGVDGRRLAEIKALAEAVKKGNVPDPKRQALMKGIKQLIDLAKHGDELAKASSTLAQPAKAVLHEAGKLTSPAPNFAAGLAVILLFISVLEKYLAKPRPARK